MLECIYTFYTFYAQCTIMQVSIEIEQMSSNNIKAIRNNIKG